MAISASLVKELRERTGAGMMECKRALEATAGDIDAAIEQMRKAGMAKADKKAGRVAAEGIVFIQPDGTGHRVGMVEVNCETDFVAKGDDFQDFVKAVANSVLEGHPSDEEDLNGKKLFGAEATTVEEARRALVAKIGENISVRRFAYVDAGDNTLGTYVHGAGRIGVVVVMEGGNEDLAKDIAMHAAAARPLCVSAEQVPADVLAKEREIFTAQAKESGKPDNIIEKMVDGRVKKYLAEVTLLGQQFVKNPDVTVEQLLKDAGAKVTQLYRFEVGEGIEKKVENFREEVMAQVHGG